MATDAERYRAAWTQSSTLDEANARIHGAAQSPEELIERGRRFRDRLISDTYPMAIPAEGSRMMEMGSGVGWIMEAMLEKFPLKEIIGLDISESLIACAQERLKDPRARFVHYDGFTFPFESDYFDNIYSAAVIQHINKDIAFLLFQEIYRTLKPGGHATLHVFSINHTLNRKPDHATQCRRNIAPGKQHHFYLYSAEELLVLFSDVIGVSDFHITRIGTALYVHFSKGGANKFLKPDFDKAIRFKG